MSGNRAYSHQPHTYFRRSITIDYDSTPTLELLRWMFAETQDRLLNSLQPPPRWTRTNALLDQCTYFNDTWIPYLATRTDELAVSMSRVLFFIAAVAFEILPVLSVLFAGIYASSKTLDLDAPKSFCWILCLLGVGLCTTWINHAHWRFVSRRPLLLYNCMHVLDQNEAMVMYILLRTICVLLVIATVGLHCAILDPPTDHRRERYPQHLYSPIPGSLFCLSSVYVIDTITGLRDPRAQPTTLIALYRTSFVLALPYATLPTLLYLTTTLRKLILAPLSAPYELISILTITTLI